MMVIIVSLRISGKSIDVHHHHLVGVTRRPTAHTSHPMFAFERFSAVQWNMCHGVLRRRQGGTSTHIIIFALRLYYVSREAQHFPRLSYFENSINRKTEAN